MASEQPSSDQSQTSGFGSFAEAIRRTDVPLPDSYTSKSEDKKRIHMQAAEKRGDYYIHKNGQGFIRGSDGNVRQEDPQRPDGKPHFTATGTNSEGIQKHTEYWVDSNVMVTTIRSKP